MLSDEVNFNYVSSLIKSKKNTKHTAKYFNELQTIFHIIMQQQTTTTHTI